MGINQEDFEKLNMRGIVISSVMTAFGLVVALAWKDTINATVEYLMPDSDDGTLKGMYITAIAVTALVMGLAVLVLKINKSLKESNLPKEIRVGAILRKNDIIIPRSNFVFEKKDLVVFLAKRDQINKVENLFMISSF